MSKKVHLDDWDYEGDSYIKLLYKDNDVLYVKRDIFNRSFGPIISVSKDVFMRDYEYQRSIIGG